MGEASGPDQQADPALGPNPSGVSASGPRRVDVKCGPPGSRSSVLAVRKIRGAVIEAIGPVKLGRDSNRHRLPDRYGLSDLLGPSDRYGSSDRYGLLPSDTVYPVEELCRRLNRAMRDYPDVKPRVSPNVFKLGTRPKGEPRPSVLSFPGWDGSELEGDRARPAEPSTSGEGGPAAERGRVYLPFMVVPTRWHRRLVRKRGRSETKRTYFEAVHVLAYVVHMYRQSGRFSGDLLHVNTSAISALLHVPPREVLAATRFLEEEKFIARVIVRGYVPWDPRVKGVYTFAIPRISSIRPNSRQER